MVGDTDENDSPPLPRHAWAMVLADPPWKDGSFAAAGLATIGGLVSWIGNLTSPVVAQMGGSFLAGFLLGWAFRKFLKMAALLVGLILAAIAALKATGWIALDWTSVESQIAQGFRWIQGEAEGLKNLLAGYLPSASAGGIGTWFGFRKK
jgi:uncharacterized membrane protein (Fun14 family)